MIKNDNEVYFTMGQSINKDIEALNKQHGRKQFKLKNINVVKNIQSAPNTHSIFFSIDTDYDADISTFFDMSKAQPMSSLLPKGIYFPVGSGLGIPPSVHTPLAARVHSQLRAKKNKDMDYLTPHHGFAPPDLSSPSIVLLEEIYNSAKNQPQLKHKAQRLKTILNDKNMLNELQATYDVADILEHFPRSISAKEVWVSQPAASMSKTYTIIPETDLSKAENKPCFSISVKLQKARSPQRLFGETPNTSKIHQGVVSQYLCNLKSGDSLPVIHTVKPQKGFKATYEAQRDVVFIAQGNAHERSLSYLQEKYADTSILKKQFILVSGFKTEADIPKNDAFKKFAKNGTLTRIYYALSRDKSPSRQDSYEHFCTGERATDILNNIDLEKLTAPVFYVAGSDPFCAAVKLKIENELGKKADIRVSNSKTRIQKPSVAL